MHENSCQASETGAGMRMRCWLALGAVSAALALMATPWAARAETGSDATATLSSSDRGVTVKVTPKSVGSPDGRWEFAIVLDTHSADLGDDLTQSATLSTDDGRTIKPLAWTGAPPGGHHRSGVLSFEVPPPRPKTIELSIVRPGEDSPRTFRWQP